MILWLNRILLLALAGTLSLTVTSLLPQEAPLEDKLWVKAGRALAKRSGDEATIVLNNAGSTEGLEPLRDLGLKPQLSLPEPRGRVTSLWLIGRRKDKLAGLHFLDPVSGPEPLAPGIYVHHLTRPGGQALWTASEALARASIRVGKLACNQRLAAGRGCASLPDWMRVTEEKVVIANKSRHCLWAHPPSGKQNLEIDFGTIPKGQLLLQHGLSDQASKSDNRSPVELRVHSAEGERLFRAENHGGYRAEKVKVSGRLRLTIRAQKDGMRHYCFEAEIK